jgi:hypothetical protein
MAIGIPNILQLLSANGGVAVSNSYKVSFLFSNTDNISNNDNTLLCANLLNIIPGFDAKHLQLEENSTNILNSNSAHIISLLCDEADIPGVQLGTGDVTGLYTGVGKFMYPHSKVYNDLTLSWICDANMTPLKFLNIWIETICPEFDSNNQAYNNTPTDDKTNVFNKSSRDYNRSTRLNYPDQYRANLRLIKGEKNNVSEIGRKSLEYHFENIFPYAIDSTPLSFGSSQLVKVSGNFYYERWYPIYHDVRYGF